MEVDSDSDSSYDGNSEAESSSDDDDDASMTSEPRNTTNKADDEDDTKMKLTTKATEPRHRKNLANATGSSQGTWTYGAVVDLDPTPRLETVGHLLMHINVDKIRDQLPPNWKFVLQKQPVIETVLSATQVPANVKPLLSHLTRVHLVPNTSTLKWGVATREALDGLPGLAFDIPVARGVTARCTWRRSVSWTLYFDVPAGFRSHAEETAFCDFIYALEPRLFYATAVTAAESTGTRGARFRLYFRGMAKPNFLLVGDKCADELLAFRRWHRIFTMDHDSAFNRPIRRRNLEVLAADLGDGATQPHVFFHFISQHTLNRLFRATYGQSRPFDVLYKLVVGENYSTTSMTTYFRKVQAAKMLPSWTIRNKDDELDDGDVLQSLDAEEILALAEVLLAINAPLVHSNDAIIATIARAPVTTIAMKEGARALSSATLLSFYKNCDEPHDTFCQDLWCQMKELAEPGTDDDEAVFSTNIELFDALITDKEWPIVGTMQVMATPHSTDGQLEVGDLDEGWADTVDDAPPRN
ncbi:hypothetical protein DYB32_009102 [Aphanomyces invadans]|uniref:Uncharacterized protein n=1 Tax=Aphanomyces invadans TaxID=157072 RepID=A0A3R6YSX7_9STRA|nr:hypothetical protein DYB32_009102 [Aphanomyces invadans]